MKLDVEQIFWKYGQTCGYTFIFAPCLMGLVFLLFDGLCFFWGASSIREINLYLRFGIPLFLFLILLSLVTFWGMTEQDIFSRKRYSAKICTCIVFINACIVFFWATLTMILLL